MQIRDLSQPVTSKKLNESLAKKFGYTINLEQFTDVQLEDARNKLRTKISQFEMNESYDSVLESPLYQKTRMFLDVLNQEILERAECDDEDVEDAPKAKKKKPATIEKTDEGYVSRTIRQRARSGSVPESWINNAISRIELGESDREELKAELAVRYDINESAASWMLLEGEEDKAEIIMATKDMVDRITGWLEDVAAMKAEQLLELLDSIGKEPTLGSSAVSQYSEAVKPALEAIYSALESSRQGLTSGLAIVSGNETPTMGAGSTPPPMPGTSLPPPGEELGGEEELPPLPTETGREKRESIDYSRRLGMLLSSKKK